MPVDYTSLLIALFFASFAILVAALASWFSMRQDRHLIFSAFGVGLVMVAMLLMGLRNGRYVVETLLVPFTLLHLGVAFIYAGTRLFLRKPDLRPAILAGIVTVLATDIPILTGFLGLSSIALNAGIAAVLFLCAGELMTEREEPNPAVRANMILYLLTALTFAAPAISQITKGEWVAYPGPDPLWDNLNAIMTLIGITGIGAITLTLHLSRVARQHRTEANTDQLTGVLNRRALFDRFGSADALPGLPVLLFDLDLFKQINDQLGHAQGDTTLREFAEILRAHLDKTDVVARIGGEEFCVVLPGRSRDLAQMIGERIRIAYHDLAMPSGREDTVSTVSVGLATGGKDENLDSILSRADAALYKAKRSGRNKLRLAEQLRAA